MKAEVIQHLQSCDLSEASVKAYAAEIGINSDLIGGVLRGEGVTWLELKIEERQRRCIEAMRVNPKINATRLAEICGYNHKPDFCRAFKNWRGYGLKQYKEAIQ